MYSGESTNDWLKLAVPGVFSIVDRVNREVYVSCSNNLIKGIATVVTKIKEKDHPCSNMENPQIEILYLGPDPKLEGSNQINRYLSDGYRVLNQVIPISLSTRIRSLPIGEKLLAVVTLRSTRGNERIIAAFDFMSEAEDWVAVNYPDGIVNRVVSLDSELTEEVRRIYE